MIVCVMHFLKHLFLQCYIRELKKKKQFFGFLKQDGKTIIPDIHQLLCAEDGLPYPYQKTDFEVEIFERREIKILKVLLSLHNPSISDILRAYFLFTKYGDSIDSRRYFVIKLSKGVKIFILYANPEYEQLLMKAWNMNTGS